MHASGIFEAMILKIRKTRKIICRDLKFAQSLKDRLFGLLLKSNPRNLLFKTRFGIHTFFLKKPIDVLILNKEYKIVEAKQFLKPNRFFFWDFRYNFVIELEQGSITKFKLKSNTELQIC